MKNVVVYGLKANEAETVHIEPPINHLSFADLDKVVGFKSAKETNNVEELSRILFENGADITKPWIVRKCLHRARTSNNTVDGFRVEFTERRDKNWLVDGSPSLEAQLYTKDESLAEVLASLDPTNARNKKRDYDEDAECSVEVSN